MSQFYGIVEGQAKTRATRRGSKNSLLTTTAASWEGAVEVTLSEKNGQDWAEVKLRPWHGKGVSRLLWEGPVSGDEPNNPFVKLEKVEVEA